MIVLLAASVVCETLNSPLTGPNSLASVKPEMLTSAMSPSRIWIVALSLPASMLMPGSPEVMLSSVTITVSSSSTSESTTMPVTSMNASVAPSGMVTVPPSVA